MLTAFEQKVHEFVKLCPLYHQPGTILLAVSGGADSVAMAHALVALKNNALITPDLAIAHINHNLRGQASDKDQQFVAGLASSLSLAYKTTSVDVESIAKSQKLSIETAARNLRIDALKQFAKQFDTSIVATAHHANDNAETILHRLHRGTSYRGLAGINPQKSIGPITYTRPLLNVTRAEIMTYLAEKDLPYRHDHTNDETTYTRNKIRHLLIPHLQLQCESDLTEKLSVLATAADKLNRKVKAAAKTKFESAVSEISDHSINLKIDPIKKSGPLERAEIFRLALDRIGAGQRHISAGHYRKFFDLIDDKGPKIIELPNHFVVSKRGQNVAICAQNAPKSATFGDFKPLLTQVNTDSEFADFLVKTRVFNIENADFAAFKAQKDRFVEWFDFDSISGPITIRTRKPGDKFQPIGSSGSKKVGKFITSQKLDQKLRQTLVIAEDTEKIIWLAPYRSAHPTRITDKTKQILEIALKSKE